MSREKLSDSEVRAVVERAMKSFGCKLKKDLACLFGILPQDMTGRIKRGTILNLIEKEAYKRNANFEYILTGKGEPFPQEGSQDINLTKDSRKSSPPSSVNGIPIADDLAKTARILESETEYAAALHRNIQSHYQALTSENGLPLEDDLTKAIGDLRLRVGNIEAQNKELMKELRPIMEWVLSRKKEHTA